MMPSSSGVILPDAHGNFDVNFTKNVTRLLQHAILQLCNEHVAYQRALQILGVLCITVDDKPQELVVKINNTLKRVNPITPPRNALLKKSPSSEYRPRSSAPPTPASSQQDLCHATPDSVSYFHLSGSSDCFESTDAISRQGLTSEERNGGGGSIDVEPAGSGAVSAVDNEEEPHRKFRSHGRKQTNPIRVKHVYDEEGRDSGSLAGENVVAIEPMDPEDDSPFPVFDGSFSSLDPRAESSELLSTIPLCPYLKKTVTSGGGTAVKRRLNELFVVPSSVASKNIVTSSPIVRALLANRTPTEEMVGGEIKQDVDEDFETPPLIIVPDDYDDDISQPSEEASTQNNSVGGSSVGNDGALNINLCAINGIMSSSQNVSYANNANNNVTIFSSTPMLQNGQNDELKNQQGTLYSDLEFLINESVTPDMSSLNKTFITFADSTGGMQMGGIGALSVLNVLQGGVQISTNQIDIGTSTRVGDFTVQAPSLFTISNCVRDSLGMHLTKKHTAILPATPIIRSRVGISGCKVKDIIMYDESAPLHAQRVSEIGGNFLMDSLNVDSVNVKGKKRKRRTSEDTLTPEEIAEYMGSSSVDIDGTGGIGLFSCRYCADVHSDVSRYLNHTLSAHLGYICHQCGKSFTTKSSLLRHRPIHTGLRRYACSICRKAFYRKDKCKAHIKLHLGMGLDGASAASGALPIEHSMVRSPPPYEQVVAL